MKLSIVIPSFLALATSKRSGTAQINEICIHTRNIARVRCADGLKCDFKEEFRFGYCKGVAGYNCTVSTDCDVKLGCVNGVCVTIPTAEKHNCSESRQLDLNGTDEVVPKSRNRCLDEFEI